MQQFKLAPDKISLHLNHQKTKQKQSLILFVQLKTNISKHLNLKLNALSLKMPPVISDAFSYWFQRIFKWQFFEKAPLLLVLVYHSFFSGNGTESERGLTIFFLDRIVIFSRGGAVVLIKSISSWQIKMLH